MNQRACAIGSLLLGTAFWACSGVVPIGQGEMDSGLGLGAQGGTGGLRSSDSGSGAATLGGSGGTSGASGGGGGSSGDSGGDAGTGDRDGGKAGEPDAGGGGQAGQAGQAGKGATGGKGGLGGQGGGSGLGGADAGGLDAAVPGEAGVDAAPPDAGGSDANMALPSHYDVCEVMGGCTPVRDQKASAASWAFVTTDVVELLIKCRTSVTRLLDEQWLMCGDPKPGGDMPSTLFGPYIDLVWRSESAAGAVWASDRTEPGTCVAHPHHEKLLGQRAVANDVVEIKRALLNNGPLFTTLCSDDAVSQYKGGVFAGSPSCKQNNHIVTLVGWDDNQGEGYWILRNVWGTAWGIQGYMHIRWGANAIGANTVLADFGGGCGTGRDGG